MRQFFTLRFWLTIAALLGLILLVSVITSGTSDSGSGGLGSDLPLPSGPATHRIDLLQPATLVQAPGGVVFTDGLLTSDVSITLDATRTMVIKAGTPGESTCPLWAQPDQCTVAADLLGDAVLWFSLVPGGPGATIKLPGVLEVQDGNIVRLANGWLLRRVSVVSLVCDDETTSLSEFVKTYADSATATFDFEQQKIVKVTCPRATATTTTVVVEDTLPPETVPPDGSTTTIEPG